MWRRPNSLPPDGPGGNYFSPLYPPIVIYNWRKKGTFYARGSTRTYGSILLLKAGGKTQTQGKIAANISAVAVGRTNTYGQMNTLTSHSWTALPLIFTWFGRQKSLQANVRLIALDGLTKCSGVCSGSLSSLTTGLVHCYGTITVAGVVTTFVVARATGVTHCSGKMIGSTISANANGRVICFGLCTIDIPGVPERPCLTGNVTSSGGKVQNAVF